MSSTALERLYRRVPHWSQNLMLNAHAFRIHRERYGRAFREALDELLASQWLSIDEIRAYQTERLRKLVAHAYATVPFYRRLYASHGVRPDDIKTLGDLARLPIITRDDVRNAGRDMISSAVAARDLVHGHTSGTTGSPLSFYWDKRTCVYNNAVDWRQKHWAGIEYGNRIALFLGRVIVPTEKVRPPFWHEDRIHRMLWVSSFHLSERFLPSIVDKLDRYGPSAIEGYPSTTYIVAKYLKSIGRRLPVKAVFTSSETLLPLQKSIIEESFDAPVFDFFGMAERVAFATQCAEAHEYHLNFEYAINEIVDSDGRTRQEGAQGYIVGTSLLNHGMPFIRYRTSDVSSISSGRCRCGRHMPRLNSVTTKEEDIVVTPDGKLISSSVLTHPFKPLDSVIESQLLQDEPDLLRVRIVRRSDFSEADTEHLLASLRERLGPLMRIQIEFVTAIPRTATGKFRWVISNVPLPL